VLVILAILAAIAIPALTGYIDKAQDRKYIAQARDYAIAVRVAIDEAYADGLLAKNATGASDYEGYLGKGGSGYTSLKIWSLATLWWYGTDDWGDHLTEEVAALMGKEYDDSFELIGSMSENTTAINADGFYYTFHPEGDSDNSPYIIVTYKLSRQKVADGALFTEFDLSKSSYDPNAGYEVYHLIWQNF
jgi:type II secretory pathway pseudopilin PulG